MMASQSVSLTLAQRVAAGDGLRMGRGSATPAAPIFSETDVSDAAVLTILWHRMSGSDPNDVGYDVSELIPVEQVRMSTPLAVSSADLRDDLKAIFVHYTCAGAGNAEQDNMMSLQSFRACMKDAGILPGSPLRLDGPKTQTEVSFSSPIRRRDAQFEQASAQIDIIFTACVRGYAARYGLLEATGSVHGMSFDVFLWALCKIALWRAPGSLKDRLNPDDATALSLTLFHFMCMMHGAKRVDGVGNAEDLLDDEVVQAFREGSACLERLFLYYGVLSSGSWVLPLPGVAQTASSPTRSLGTTPHTDGATLPIKPNFFRFAQEFGICPGLLSRGKLLKVCSAVDPQMAPLLFPGFVELLGRIALVAFEQKPFAEEYPTPGSRVSALIRKLRLEPAFEACGVELRQRGLNLLMGEELWYAEAAVAGMRPLTTRMSMANQLTGRVDSSASGPVYQGGSSSVLGPLSMGRAADDEDDEGLALLSASALGPSTAAAPTAVQPIINVSAVMEHRSPRLLSALRQAALVPLPLGTVGSAALQSTTGTYLEGADSSLGGEGLEAEGTLVSPGEQAALMQYLASSRVVADFAASHGYSDDPSLARAAAGSAQSPPASNRGRSSFVGNTSLSSSVGSPGLVVRSFPSAGGLPSRITEAEDEGEGRSSAESEAGRASFAPHTQPVVQSQPALMRLGSEAVLDVEQGARVALEAAGQSGETARPVLQTSSAGVDKGSAAVYQAAQLLSPASQGQSTSSKRRSQRTGAALSKLGGSGNLSASVTERDFSLAEQVLTDILASPNGHSLVLPAIVPAPSTQTGRAQLASPPVGSGTRRQSSGADAPLPPSPPHETEGTAGTGSTATASTSAQLEKVAEVEKARKFLRASPRASSTRSLLSQDSAPSTGGGGPGSDTAGAEGQEQPLVASVRPTRSLKLVREASLSRIQAADVSAGKTKATQADGTVTDLPLQPLAGKPTFAKGFVSANSDKARSASATARDERRASIGSGRVSMRGAGSVGSPRVAAGTVLSEGSTAHEIVHTVSQGVPTPFPMPGMARMASARVLQVSGQGWQAGEDGRRAAALDTSLIADATAELQGKKAPRPFASPTGSRGRVPARSLPPAPQSLGPGHVVHPVVIDTLLGLFQPVVQPVLLPIFLYYSRLGAGSGNKGRMSHKNFFTLCKDIDLIDARIDTGAVELQLAVLQAKAVGNQDKDRVGKGETGLNLQQFTEALLRMSELVRRAQQKPAEPGAAALSPRDGPPEGNATLGGPLLFADGGSIAVGTAEGADISRAKVVAADFLARRVLPLLGLAREADAVAASLCTLPTVQLLNEHAQLLRRIFAHYATYIGEPAPADGEGEGQQTAADSSADSTLHLSALQGQQESGKGLQPPYMPAHAILPAAWLRLCKDIEVVPGLASLHAAEAAMNESARRAGTFSTLDTSLEGLQQEASLEGAPSDLLSRRTAFNGRRSIPADSSSAAAIAMAGRDKVSRGPLHRKGKEVPGSTRLEPVHLSLSQPTAHSAGIPALPADAHKPLPSPADGTHLLYPAFVEALCRIAVAAFSASTLGNTYPSATEKVAGLLAWVQSGRRLRLDVAWGKPGSASAGPKSAAAADHSAGSSVGLQYAPAAVPAAAAPRPTERLPVISAAQLLQLVHAHSSEAAQGVDSTAGGSTLSQAASALAQSLGLPAEVEGSESGRRGRPTRSRSTFGPRSGRTRSTEGGHSSRGQAGKGGHAQAVSWLAHMEQGMEGAAQAQGEAETYMALQAVNVLTSVAGPEGVQAVAAGHADAATVTVQAALGGARSPSGAGKGRERAEAEALRLVAASLASSGATYGLDVATSSRMADAVRGAAPSAPPALTRSDLDTGGNVAGVAFSPLGAYPKPYASRRTHRIIAVKQTGKSAGREEDAGGAGTGQGAADAGLQVLAKSSVKAQASAASHSPFHDAVASGTLPSAPLFHKGEDKYYARIVAARGVAASRAVKTTLRAADAPLRMTYHVAAQLQGIQVQAKAEEIAEVNVTVDGVVQAKTAQGSTLTAGPAPGGAASPSASGTAGRGRSKGRRRAPPPPLPASPTRQVGASGGVELFSADGSLDPLAALLACEAEGEAEHGTEEDGAGSGAAQGMTMSMLSPRAKLRAYHAAHRESVPESAFAPAAEALSVPLRGEIMQQFYTSLRSDTLTAGPSGTSSEFRVQRAGTGTVLRRIDLVHQTDTNVPAEATDQEVIDPKTVPQPRLWAATDVIGSPNARGKTGAVPPLAPVAPVAAGAKAFTQKTAPDVTLDMLANTSTATRGRPTVAAGRGETLPAAAVAGSQASRSRSKPRAAHPTVTSDGHGVTLVRPTNTFVRKQQREQEKAIADLTAGLGDDVAAMVRAVMLDQPQPKPQPSSLPGLSSSAASTARAAPRAAASVSPPKAELVRTQAGDVMIRSAAAQPSSTQELPTSPLSSAAAAAIAALDAAARRSPSPTRSPQQKAQSPQQRQSVGGTVSVPARYTSPSAGERERGDGRRSMPMPAMAAALARASTQTLLQSPTGVTSPLGSPGSLGPALQQPRSTAGGANSNNLLYNAGLSMATAASAQARLDRIIGKAAGTSPGPSPRQVKSPVHVSITSPVGLAALSGPVVARLPPQAPASQALIGARGVAGSKVVPGAQPQQQRYRRSTEDDTDEYGGGGYEVE